jgi:hypothetical protein
MRSLIEKQRRLQVATGGDFLRRAIWARRVALMTAFDSLALESLPSVCAFRVCVENGSLPHSSFLELLFTCIREARKVRPAGLARKLRQGLFGLSLKWHGFIRVHKRHRSPHFSQTVYCGSIHELATIPYSIRNLKLYGSIMSKTQVLHEAGRDTTQHSRHHHHRTDRVKTPAARLTSRHQLMRC